MSNPPRYVDLRIPLGEVLALKRYYCQGPGCGKFLGTRKPGDKPFKKFRGKILCSKCKRAIRKKEGRR